MFKKKSDQLDYSKINEGVTVGVGALKIVFFLLILVAFYIIILLLAKLKVLPFIFEVLEIISPLFIGIVIAWLFDPFVTKLEKKGVNRILGSVFSYLLLILGILLIGKLTIPSITGQINELVSSLPNIINYAKDFVSDLLRTASHITGYDLSNTEVEIFNFINDFGASLTVNLPTMVMNFVSGILTGGVNLIFGFIVGFYMLFDFRSIRKHFLSVIPTSKKNEVSELIDRLNYILKRYVVGTLEIMLILFVFQSIALSIAGMKAPLVFGLFCAITNVIPYFGPYIGGIPTVVVGFSISPVVGIFTLIAVVVAQTLESYFLQPIVMGKTMNLHPVTIMIGLLLFGHFFGILGMVLATPIISVFKTIFVFYNEKYNILKRLFNI